MEGPPPAIVHEDASCIVVDKPAGRLSVPGRGALATQCVAVDLQALRPLAQVVHRLDMATSGLLLFANGPYWQRTYSRLFAARAIDKGYVARVHGRLGSAPGDTGAIALPLAPDWPNRPRQRVDPQHGKPSLTHWRVLAHDPAGAWTTLALSPVTGRSHQLRVHLLAIGHPIVGDALYDAPRAAAAPRLMLHAASLAFDHPLLGERLHLQAPLPF